jgi:hypothetical protein
MVFLHIHITVRVQVIYRNDYELHALLIEECSCFQMVKKKQNNIPFRRFELASVYKTFQNSQRNHKLASK